MSVVEEEVRELVRRRGVDPSKDGSRGVEPLVDEVLDDYEQRSSVSSLPRIEDRNGVRKAVLDKVAGFGPLQPLLDDPEVEEIWINAPGKVFCAKGGRHLLTNVVLDESEIPELVERMLRTSGRRLDLSSPFVDGTLADGSRLHVVIPDITRRHWAVNIRKFVLRAHQLSELVRLGSLEEGPAQFLEASVEAGLNVVVSGGTQTGKTTMLNCLAASIPGRDRVVSVEEVFELRFSHPDWVAMQTRQQGLEGTGEIRLRDLVKESLRMRPSRVIVGEVRAEECLDLLLALNAGLPGMASLHANSAREALVKMCTLPLLAGENISSRFVVPTVAASVDLVVHLGIGHDGVRWVEEIVAVPGRVENDVIETEPVFVRQAERLVRTQGMPPRAERFERLGIDIRALLNGGA